MDGSLDLGNHIWVVPSAHGANRLAELLREHAKQSELEFWPPKIITTGELPEYLYSPSQTIARDFEQTLAWSSVLRSETEQSLSALIPTLPAKESINAWLELAGTLRHLHEDLSANRLTFDDVAAQAETESEKRRWGVLSHLFQNYLSVIADAGLDDPHHARQLAVADQSCEADYQIVLIGTTDLSDLLTDMLRTVKGDVMALVAAPESESFRFDEFGGVDTQAWLDHKLPLKDEQLISAADVSDQSIAVAEVLAEVAPDFLPKQITIGVTDESHVGPVEMQLTGCGVSTYRHLGWTVSETAVGRLFELTANHLQRASWQTLAAFVRHADIYEYVERVIAADAEALAKAAIKNEKKELDHWLVQLDGMLAAHFPLRVSDALPPATSEYPLAAKVAEIVSDLVSPFDGDPKTISQWSKDIVSWLAKVFAPTNDKDDDSRDETRTQKSVRAACALLNRFHELNHHLDVDVSGAVAFETLATRLGELRVNDARGVDDVEVLGWLDLATDDAEAVIVMGFNHPFVPGAVTNDPFLPGALRTQLRMVDNDRRYARDVFAMQSLLCTRKFVRFIVGSTGADGSPTPPSRMMAAAEPVDSARRIRQLSAGRKSVIVKHRWDVDLPQTELPIPELCPSEYPVSRMSVTAFRDYLICPYRFYLRHVLRIRPVDDATGELAANQFGDLVHGTLELFGESDEKSLTDPNKIEAALIDQLHSYAEQIYGKGTASAVKLQVMQAERRLKFVAKEQAKRIAAGWVIHKTEASVNETATEDSQAASIVVDDKPMGIRGRFDRIDFHPDSGRWAILDYKTHGHKPEKKHLKRNKEGSYDWVDLQLPLYRMLIPFLGIESDPSDVELGYFNVSEKQEETRINIADFSEDQMSTAEEVIRQIIRDIWSGKFEPTSDRVQYDDYEMILQTRVPQRILNRVESVEDSGVFQEVFS